MRPTKPRAIGCIPACRRFRPSPESEDMPADGNGEVVTIRLDMLEAMRLVDAEGLCQEEAASSMGVSPPTLCRILGQGRRLSALALTTGKIIKLEGGNIMYCYAMQGRGQHKGPCGHGHGRWQRSAATQTNEDCSCDEGAGRGCGMAWGRCGAGRGQGRRNAQPVAHESSTQKSDADAPEHTKQ